MSEFVVFNEVLARWGDGSLELTGWGWFFGFCTFTALGSFVGGLVDRWRS